MQSRILAVAALVLFSSVASRAGGPAFVAGSGYNPGVAGQPLVWANASVQYFTDQGNLSPILSGAQADTFVASAMTAWISLPGVALTATYAGHLAEDVNGSNIQATVNGVITAPADITPTALGTPLGIVYDYDGTVTDAVLGQGAGGIGDCFTNAVYGGPDNFSQSGNIVHAVIIINGVCAATNDKLPDVQYRLVRVLGRVFGLGWSQANVNVQTRNPVPTSADYAGFPVMHFMDLVSCVPISVCYPNAAVPKMDDVTALARLYTAANPQPSGRVWGNVYFADSSGNATQEMQGVNVVARLIDNSGQPSRQYVVSSVSGFKFVGNAGNIILGYVDANGLRFDRFGSSDISLEGFFDLGQLTIPSGQYALYQLSVEAIDPNWSWGVEPYAPSQVLPSGSFAPVTVTVASGSNSERDILMLGSEIAQTHPGSGSTYMNPAPLPQGGGWSSWISGYGSADWFEFTAQANRTASFAVTAVDEAGRPTESKLLPVIGIWELSDNSQNPAPASTPSAFNSLTFGMTRLDALFHKSEAYRLGVADYRGDGRPDYSYQASVLYSDTVTPARLSVAGGVIALQGIGFKPGLHVSGGGNNGTVLSQSATQIQVALPAAALDGTATIQVTDPASGSFSQMIGALTYGAAVDDQLLLLQGSEPATPVGAQAANLLRVRATASDGLTPVNGATIAWSATNGTKFSACNPPSSSCSVLTDQAGESSTWVTQTAVGPSTITAALAPASYPSPQIQQMTLATSQPSPLDLAAVAPYRWIAQGATLSVPLTVEALSSGVPKANVVVNYTVTQGTASLSSGTATTNGAGLATVTAQLTNLAATVQVSACVSPGNNPCQTFTLYAVPVSLWTLEPVSGTSQVVPNGQTFQKLVMRVTDSSPADNPVQGVNVTFVTTLERNPQGPGGPFLGDSYQGQGAMPVILGTLQSQGVTDQNGLVSIVPSVGSLGPCELYVVVTAGSAMVQFELESVDPIAIQIPTPPNIPNKRPVPRAPRRVTPLSSPPAVSPEVAATLFAVPELAPSTQPLSEMVPDTSQNADPIPDAGSLPAGSTCPSAEVPMETLLKCGAGAPAREKPSLSRGSNHLNGVIESFFSSGDVAVPPCTSSASPDHPAARATSASPPSSGLAAVQSPSAARPVSAGSASPAKSADIGSGAGISRGQVPIASPTVAGPDASPPIAADRPPAVTPPLAEGDAYDKRSCRFAETADRVPH